MGDRQSPDEPMSPEVAVMVLQSELSGPRLLAQAVATLAELVSAHVPERIDLPDGNGYPACWHFVGYRPDAAALGLHQPWQLNEADAPQYQGVIFADGSVAVRWLTARRSTSVWETFADMFDVHGHPEYGTVIRWTDGAPQEALDVIAAAEQAAQERDAELAAQLRAGDREAVDTSTLDAEPYPGAVVRRLAAERARDVTEQLVILPEDTTGKTLVVCLDCDGSYVDGHPEVLIVPFAEREDADSWLRVHRQANPEHRVVTVPGWPPRGQAIAIARQHGRELRAGQASGGER